MKKKRILLLGGKSGLLGVSLFYMWKDDHQLELIVHGKEDFDVLDFKELSHYLHDVCPDVIVNTVSFNQINLAEQKTQQAFLINEHLLEPIINFSKEKNTYLIHFSTSMVFDGKKGTPYSEDDEPWPINVFGRSKLKGEQRILESFLQNYLIIRTSWLFGKYGYNFVNDLIELIKRDKKIIACHNKVIAPTYTNDLAQFSLELIKKNVQGIVNITNSGYATLCEIAQEIVRITGVKCVVEPKVVADKNDYNLAPLPDYGVLDLSKLIKILGKKPRSWMLALRDYLFSIEGIM